MRGRTYDIRGLYAKNACITSLIMTRGELLWGIRISNIRLRKAGTKETSQTEPYREEAAQ